MKQPVILLIIISVLILISGCLNGGKSTKPTEDAEQNPKLSEINTRKEKDLTVKFDEKLINSTSWNISPTFESGGFEMIGVAQKVGVIYEPFEVEKTQKYMWHFWGKDLPYGKLTVLGFKEGSNTATPVLELDGKLVWSSRELGGVHNGADAHIPSNMKIKEPGKWKLLIFIGETYIDNIVIEVK